MIEHIPVQTEKPMNGSTLYVEINFNIIVTLSCGMIPGE